MPALPTPGQLNLRAELYQQIATFAASGIPVRKALETLHRSPPSRSFKQPLARLIARLNSGLNFSESLRAENNWLPEFDIALIEAGERSGRLDTSLGILAEYYREQAALVRTMIGELAYPVFVLHAGIFIMPIPALVTTGNVGAYLTATFGALVPIYVITALLIFAGSGKNEKWRAFLELFCRYIPLLGKARRALALSRLSAALGALLNAGVLVINAWELAAAGSGSPAIRREVNTWRPLLENQHATPSDLASKARVFPDLFSNIYHSGEISGQLDESLNRLYRHYQDEGFRKLRTLAKWFPMLIYLAIMAKIALAVIGFWSGHINSLNAL